jgi:hypothetical protein
MAYFKDAQGDWMTQPAGMVPSWRGWPQGLIGPSASYRMPPLTKMSGCGACGGLGQEESDTDYDVGTIDPVTGQVNENLPPVEQEGKITPEESEQLAKQAAAQAAKPGGMGTILLLGLGAVGLFLLLGKTRRNPCRRNAPVGKVGRMTTSSRAGAARGRHYDVRTGRFVKARSR